MSAFRFILKCIYTMKIKNSVWVRLSSHKLLKMTVIFVYNLLCCVKKLIFHADNQKKLYFFIVNLHTCLLMMTSSKVATIIAMFILMLALLLLSAMSTFTVFGTKCNSVHMVK